METIYIQKDITYAVGTMIAMVILIILLAKILKPKKGE